MSQMRSLLVAKLIDAPISYTFNDARKVCRKTSGPSF